MALTPQDRDILKRCLNHERGAWNDFVDRFLGLVYHVITHTAHLRSFDLQPEDTEDIAAQVLLQLVDKDYSTLRQFRGKSSLATYLTVITRRTSIHEMVKRGVAKDAISARTNHHSDDVPSPPKKSRPDLETLEEIGKMLSKLPSRERAVVRLFYLEGRTYEQISTELSIPVNHIGVILSRAKKKLRGDNGTPPPPKGKS